MEYAEKCIDKDKKLIQNLNEAKTLFSLSLDEWSINCRNFLGIWNMVYSPTLWLR